MPGVLVIASQIDRNLEEEVVRRVEAQGARATTLSMMPLGVEASDWLGAQVEGSDIIVLVRPESLQLTGIVGLVAAWVARGNPALVVQGTWLPGFGPARFGRQDQPLVLDAGTVIMPQEYPSPFRTMGAVVLDPASPTFWEDFDRAFSAMVERLRRPITALSVQAFTCFEDIECSFCGGINVLIGPNSTGKTHILKLLYAICRAAEYADRGPAFDTSLLTRLLDVFMPEGKDAARLLRMSPARVAVRQDRASISLEIGRTDGIRSVVDGSFRPPTPVFIPPKEVVSLSPSLIPAVDAGLALDATYKDLCVDLLGFWGRAQAGPMARSLVEELEQLIGGPIRLENGRFYRRDAEGESRLEAHLLAEGYRKFATIAQLLGNGRLRRSGCLFWDEPEANLNPRLIARVAELLRRLAAEGIQVFLSTHDYLLTHLLSLPAEYGQPVPLVRFFSLFREKESEGVQVEWADTLPGLEHNDILSEHAALFDLERELALRSARSAVGDGA